MDIKRCGRCRGAKEVMAIGMQIKECPECQGVGYVEDEKKALNVEPIEDVLEQIEEIKKPSKKRGRPKKVKDLDN